MMSQYLWECVQERNDHLIMLCGDTDTVAKYMSEHSTYSLDLQERIQIILVVLEGKESIR